MSFVLPASACKTDRRRWSQPCCYKEITTCSGLYLSSGIQVTARAVYVFAKNESIFKRVKKRFFKMVRLGKRAFVKNFNTGRGFYAVIF